MYTDIDELYTDTATYGYGKTPVASIYNVTAQRFAPSPSITSPTTVHTCVEIYEHVQNCPLCSMFYNKNVSELEVKEKETYKPMKQNTTCGMNQTSKICIAVLGAISIILGLLLLQTKFSNRRRSQSPYRKG